VADVYVNDASGSGTPRTRRPKVSPKFVPQAASGFLMKRELDYLGDALGNSQQLR
jgi:3-phosphoglycerate kinase